MYNSAEAAKHILSAYDIIRDEYDQLVDGKTKKLAKRICRYNGNDADVVVMKNVPCYGPKNSLLINYPLVPVWALYIEEAVMFLNLMENEDGE